MMTIHDAQIGVMRVLHEAVTAHALLVANPEPMRHDPAGHQAAVSRCQSAVAVAKACCAAAGVAEKEIRQLVDLSFAAASAPAQGPCGMQVRR